MTNTKIYAKSLRRYTEANVLDTMKLDSIPTDIREDIFSSYHNRTKVEALGLSPRSKNAGTFQVQPAQQISTDKESIDKSFINPITLNLFQDKPRQGGHNFKQIC
ncbi:unnamed protein product [Ceratitis capitata]|uniref:(Mediterranean fruit fly) hypothetical protein n=1 Tax=Ceratitis capitata TaxID=7213 RepID=A0A811UX28_CERCA|nr:unnamed protein product [Ceratitis capitata]